MRSLEPEPGTEPKAEPVPEPGTEPVPESVPEPPEDRRPGVGLRPAEVRAGSTTARLRWLGSLWAGGLLVVFLLGSQLRDATVTGLDARLHGVALRHRDDDLLLLARGITEGGSTKVVWPLLVIAALTFPRSGRGVRSWVVALVVGAAAGMAIGLRRLTSIVIQRQRPPEVDWVMDAGGYAFPSGHTTAATVGIGFLAWAVTRHMTDRRGRAAVWVLAVAYAALVGWSRVWLGVHWPLDVLGGWLLGSAWLCGMAALVGLLARRRPGWIDG